MSRSFRLNLNKQRGFVLTITTTLCSASKLWAYLIPTPANLLIYKEPGYNLKVRGSNPLPATNYLLKFITNHLRHK